MHEVLIEKTLNASADNVWGVLSDFSNLSWYAPAERVEKIGDGVGQIRRIYMPGMDNPVDEKLESMDPAAKTFSYSIPDMPMQNYKVVVALQENGANCDVRWHATFTGMEGGLSADDMIAVMTDTYSGMLGDIETAANA